MPNIDYAAMSEDDQEFCSNILFRHESRDKGPNEEEEARCQMLMPTWYAAWQRLEIQRDTLSQLSNHIRSQLK